MLFLPILQTKNTITQDMKKYVKVIICLAVLAGIALFVKSRWNAWFGNIPEMPYAASPMPDRITLTPGEDFMTQRTVSWRCGDTLAQSALTLVGAGDSVVLQADGVVVESRGGRDAFYCARLDSLRPGAEYRYRVSTGGVQSATHSFVMPSEDKPWRRFIFFGDVQDTVGGRSGQWFAKLYRQFPDADFWACAGDLVERPIDAYWNYFYSTADSILASLPLLTATGNHDYLKSLYPSIDPRWRHTFVYPGNGAATAIGISYYIDLPDLRIMVFDSHGINDCVTLAARYRWLRDCLRGADGKWKVVMYHHPAYSVRASRNNLQIRNTFVPLMEKYGVHLVLQGHEHGYMRNIGTRGDHPVYIVSYMSPKAYPARDPAPGFKVIGGTPMYHTVDYDDTEMVFRSYAVDNDSLVDSVTVSRFMTDSF